MIVFKWLRTPIEVSRISARNSKNFSNDSRGHRTMIYLEIVDLTW